MVQPMQVLLGRRTIVGGQVMEGAPQVLPLSITWGATQPQAVPCHVSVPWQMQVLLVELLPMEKMVLLQTIQVAVVPVPMMMAAELEQTQPTLGDQTNRALLQLQAVEVSALIAYLDESQATQL
jgi:hypothetical protein